MSPEQQQLQAGITALESQRAVLGDAVVDASLAGLRAKPAALASPPPASTEPTQTLRQVSILFLDVVGSTALAQRLDPEAISAVLDDALQRGTTMVEQHHGKVLQYAGDNILAAFGADEAREDDAERAVRCGLALLELGKTLGAEVLTAHRHAGFNVRVGIHTGGVLLGGGVDAEASIRGQAVNIAEGVATRMIGRDAELEALQDAFKRLFQERNLAAVTVVADAGLGKSRLLTEFEAWSETRPESFYLFRGRATPQTQGQPYGLLRDILAWRFQITDDDSIEAARQKMEQAIVPLFEADDGPERRNDWSDITSGHRKGLAATLLRRGWPRARESDRVRPCTTRSARVPRPVPRIRSQAGG